MVALGAIANRGGAADPIELPVGEGKVIALAFSADGKQLAVGTSSSVPTVKIFQLGTNQEVANFPCEGRGAPFTVAFSPDGKRIAFADYDLNVKIHEVKDGAEVASLPADPDRKKYRQGRQVAFLPDGKSLVVGYSTGEVFIWEIAGKQVTVKFDHGNQITALAVSRDGRQVATGTDFGLRIWSAVDGKKLVSLDKKSSGEHQVTSIAFLPDGMTVVTADSPGFVRLFATADGKEIRSYKMPSVGKETTIYGLGITALGQSIVVPGLVAGLNPERPKLLNEGILVLDVATAKAGSFLPAGKSRVFAMSADGKTAAIASGESGDGVSLYDLNTAKRLTPETK
jgi:WD40 repeat protein